MEPIKDNKNKKNITKKPDKSELDKDYIYKEDIPSEDVDMLREKNDPIASSAYDGDNSYEDR